MLRFCYRCGDALIDPCTSTQSLVHFLRSQVLAPQGPTSTSVGKWLSGNHESASKQPSPLIALDVVCSAVQQLFFASPSEDVQQQHTPIRPTRKKEGGVLLSPLPTAKDEGISQSIAQPPLVAKQESWNGRKLELLDQL